MYRYISSMMIHCSTYFASIGHFFEAKMKMKSTVSMGGGSYGTGDAGGINSHTFAKDGEISHLVRHPTCVFHSSTNGTPVENMLAHSPPLPLTVDYWSEDGITLQKMKRGYCLLSSSVIPSATSAFSSLFRICRSLSWPSMRNSRSWNT
jgi:hypothetical protein